MKEILYYKFEELFDIIQYPAGEPHVQGGMRDGNDFKGLL
jgi:hypothetical protein